MLFRSDRFEAVVVRPLEDALNVSEPRRAKDINSLGEAPDSTWFTNRMGLRQLSLREVARGPNRGDGPDLSAPLVILKSKGGGSAIGFVAEDVTGTRYILKFDHLKQPIIETATDVVVQRILWACGYNVPENSVIYLGRDRLAVTERSTIRDAIGKRPLTESDVDEVLTRVPGRADGRFRVLASKYLPGVPVGGISPVGVREDDVNDTIRHEDRRVLRGLYVFFSWLQYTDVKSGNTLDMWVEDAERPGRHYVMHYLLDFGKSLGAFGPLHGRIYDGHAYNFDFMYDFLSLFTLGLWQRPWEGTPDPGLPGLSPLDAEHFDPGAWKPHWPYSPFRHMDEYDGYWAAKIVMSFTPAHIRVAVEQGRFDHARAVEHLTRVLVQRQRRIGEYWFRRVNPLDGFALGEREGRVRLCFDDLLLRHGLADRTSGRYAATSFNFSGKSLGWRADVRPGIGTAATGNEQGHAYTACVDGFSLAENNHGYTIVRLDTWRGDRRLLPVEVHIARHPISGVARIIGIHRR